VSITQRILESAQSQWSKLTSLVIVDEEPLSHIDAAALQAELAARKAGRATARKASENPIAKMAGAGEPARTAREKAATARRARVVRERDERAAKQKAANDDAFRRMKDDARTSGNSGFGGSSARTSQSTGSARSPRPGSSEAQLQEWQKTLGVQPGADLAQIKSAYRQLMRKYHPDMHAGNPQKEKAATELSLKVTSAYNGLMAHLEKQK
jgi:DnaJ-domain-containing protein 1